MGGVVLVFVIAISVPLLSTYGGVLTSSSRFILNIVHNFIPVLDNQNINGLLTNPFPQWNMMPFWITSLWIGMLVVACLSEERFVENSAASIGSLIIFILGIVAVYFGFIAFQWTPQVMSQDRILGVWYGQQYRYITPTLLLFAIIVGSKKFKWVIPRFKGMVIAMFVIVVGSGLMLFFDSWFNVLLIA